MSYVLKTSAKGYYTSLDAKNKVNSNSIVPAGTYEVYNRANGVVNITRRAGQMGWWINESESPSAPSTISGSGVTANAGSSSNTASGNIPYTGSNKATVFAKNPHYVHPVKDNSVVLYITNIVTGTTIEIDVTPSSFSENNKANFDGQEIRGRSNVLQGFNSTGPRTASLSFTLYDDYCYYGIRNTINFLKALNYPNYSSGFVSPPLAYIKYGKMLAMRCFISADITYDGPIREGEIISASISLSLTEITNESMSAQQIEQGKDYL